MDYSDESSNHEHVVLTIQDVNFTSSWSKHTTKLLNIVVRDVPQMLSSVCLYEEAKMPVMPEWKNGSWLDNVDIKSLQYTNKVKTLVSKIKNIYIASTCLTEMLVDGFMDSLLHILCFDDYPCLVYPQYQYSAYIGPNNHVIKAKPDFSVLSSASRMLLVVEDNALTNATLANNWKEDQVLGELFVAVHNIAARAISVAQAEPGRVEYPVSVYAVRVIGTLFTFYRATAKDEYIISSAQGTPTCSLEVQRFPRVEESPRLTAYDICSDVDRLHILECMCSIRESIIG